MINVFENLTGWIKWVAIGSVITVSVGAITGTWLYIQGSERAKAQNISLTEKLDTATRSTRTNQASYELCELTNLNNALEAGIQRDRAHQAELRLTAAEGRYDRQLEDYQREATEFNNRGLACPAMDQRFREWLLDHS